MTRKPKSVDHYPLRGTAVTITKESGVTATGLEAVNGKRGWRLHQEMRKTLLDSPRDADILYEAIVLCATKYTAP